MRSRKRFGQHFLSDNLVINHIIDIIDPGPGEVILEIGPGRGAITEALVQSGCKLEVVEIDRDLIAVLSGTYGQRITIHEADVMKFDFGKINRPANTTIRVVGNLPYNISTPLLFRLFNHQSLWHELVFMLQKEVVERITASPGSKDYGRLSVMSQYFCDAEKVLDVPPESFTPPPRVESAVIRMTPKPADEQVAVDTGTLENVLITAFSKRRKTVRNALSGLLSNEDLMALDINPGLRPENLTPSEFIRCANHINGQA